MARSIYRGPVNFEDGTTAEDVEKFDDGTWINHGAARKQMYGQIMKEAADRAERQIEVPSTQSCTVLRVQPAVGVAGGVAVVSVDGDPVGETRDVTISATYLPRAGDRAQIAYQQPHGATIVAPLGSQGMPAGAITNICAGGGQTIAGVTADQIDFCCEEFVTGGMESDAGTLLRAPLTAVYSVHAEISLGITDVGAVTVNLTAVDPAYGTRTISSFTYEHETFINPVDVSCHVGRAAVVLTETTVLVVNVLNITPSSIFLNDSRMDATWEVEFTGEVTLCFDPCG